MENRENLDIKITKELDDNKALLNEDYKDLLSKALDVIAKQSDYDLKEKEINRKYRFYKFIAILLFIVALWSVFYFAYFNASMQIERYYKTSNINYNENINNTSK